jgi:hypothetical protein
MGDGVSALQTKFHRTSLCFALAPHVYPPLQLDFQVHVHYGSHLSSHQSRHKIIMWADCVCSAPPSFSHVLIFFHHGNSKCGRMVWTRSTPVSTHIVLRYSNLVTAFVVGAPTSIRSLFYIKCPVQELLDLFVPLLGHGPLTGPARVHRLTIFHPLIITKTDI